MKRYSFLTDDLLLEGLWSGVKTAAGKTGNFLKQRGKNTLYNTGYIIGKSKKPLRKAGNALASDTAKTIYKGAGYLAGGTALGVGALGAAALSD